MSSRNPESLPYWNKKMLSAFVPFLLLEELEGDLLEVYTERIKQKGKALALCMLWLDTFHLLYGFGKFKQVIPNNSFIMLFNNMIKIAFRNAKRHTQFTILNLLGLSLGIGVTLLIALYVYHESTFDTFHAKKDRIYRINQPNIWNDWNEKMANTGPNVAVALRADIPEFESITRLMTLGDQTIKNDNNGGQATIFIESKVFAAESNFFDVFSFEIVEGNAATAFEHPNQVVMTQATAQRYFGFKDAIGKTVMSKNYSGEWETFTVSAIVKDVTKSHIDFDMLFSLKSYQQSMKRDEWKWIWTAFGTYGLVKEGTNITALEEKIQNVPPKWAPPTTEKIFNQSFEEFTAGHDWTLYLQPLSDIYQSSSPDIHSFGPTGKPIFVRLFSIVGALILLLSCINFMNLTTAKSANRSKEVGIRKVMGSDKKTIMLQFIFESILYVGMATLIGFMLVFLTIDWFNAITSLELSFSPWTLKWEFYSLITGFIVLLGIFAGSYPAFYLSSFRPISVLKGKVANGLRGQFLRNSLVVFQFTVSIGLIICTVFVHKQILFVSEYDVGYAQSHILQIHNLEQFGFDTKHIKDRFSQRPEFEAIGKSFGVPPSVWSGDRYKLPGDATKVLQFRNWRTEEDYINLLGLEFVEGRNFDPDIPTDRYKIIVNEKVVNALGWNNPNDSTSSIIGKKIALASGNEDEFEIIGVVKDFNYNSIHYPIEPLLMLHQNNDKVWDYGWGMSFLSLKIDPNKVRNKEEMYAMLDMVKGELFAINESVPFDYSFLDNDFEQTFNEEKKAGTLITIFTGLAVWIACLGLFGLAAFSAEQRLKELSIRKVLGANLAELIRLFSLDFIKLILISIGVAIPLSYLCTAQWLQTFAYQTKISVWVFIAVAGASILITWFTIAYQAIRVALGNPIDVLNEE